MSRVTPDDLVRTLYVTHGRQLLAYASRLTGDPHHGEDVVQETLLRAWCGAATLRDDPAQVRAWLYRVAHNLAVDQLRARRPCPAGLSVEHLERADESTDPVDRVLTSLELSAALRALTPEHRGVLIDVYCRDRTLAEIAETLKIPHNTVKSRLRQALARLRAILPGRTPGDGERQPDDQAISLEEWRCRLTTTSRPIHTSRGSTARSSR